MPKPQTLATVSPLDSVAHDKKSTHEVQDENLFAVPVRTIQWSTEQGFNETLAELLGAFYRDRIKNRVATHQYNLWHEFSEVPEVRRLRDMFVEGLSGYIDEFLNPEVKKTYDYEMAAWLRIDNPKQVLAPHFHSQTQVAATYYCQVDIAQHKWVDTGYGKLREGDLVVLDTEPKFSARFLKQYHTHSISPKVGTMVLMPGRLMHWVNPVSEGDARICIANNFNFSPKKSVGLPCSF